MHLAACLPPRALPPSLPRRSGCERRRAARRSWRAATSSTPSSTSGCSSRCRHPPRPRHPRHPSQPCQPCQPLHALAPPPPQKPIRRKDPVAIREGFKRVERWTKHIDLFNKARLLQKHTTPATVVRKACNRSSTRLQPRQHAPATVAARACNRSSTRLQPPPRRTSSSCRSPRASTGLSP